jgi:hypothetical protein
MFFITVIINLSQGGSFPDTCKKQVIAFITASNSGSHSDLIALYIWLFHSRRFVPGREASQVPCMKELIERWTVKNNFL